MPIKLGDLTLYDVEDLVKKFGIHRMTVRRYFRNGKLKGRKIGRKWYVAEDVLHDYFRETEETRKAAEGKA